VFNASGAIKVLLSLGVVVLGVIGESTVALAQTTWSTTATDRRARSGEQFTYTCPGNGSPSTVWGTDIYTDDSSICTAAVHAGLISFASGGTVTIAIRPGRDSFTGSTRNGVATGSWGAWGGSFVFVTPGTTTPPAPPPATPVAPAAPPPASPPAAPPAEVPAAPAPSAPQSLGLLDLNSYCQAIEYEFDFLGLTVEVTPYDGAIAWEGIWYCASLDLFGSGIDVYSDPIDPNDACQWQYDVTTAFAVPTGVDPPWACALVVPTAGIAGVAGLVRNARTGAAAARRRGERGRPLHHNGRRRAV